MATKENDEKFLAVSEELASEKASHQESIKKAETLEAQNAELSRRIDGLTGEGAAASENDRMLRAVKMYLDDPTNSDTVMEELDNIGPDYLSDASEAFRDLYSKMRESAADDALKNYIDTAREALKTKDYKTAIDYYTKACELAPENEDYLTDLAYAYRESGDDENAAQIYRRIIDEFPGSQNAAEASEYLSNR